ncbi:hypothetical protein SIID45300_01760 [Candidatus Magnetaquicoccaceae bacterium FCR-1]|uniref:Uncharacterized protein n=1 Tax=Candidatus Magnetaquiglobus chichijimensis TaxID=3141448 RepID=A0ABQ0C978_9PROT
MDDLEAGGVVCWGLEWGLDDCQHIVPLNDMRPHDRTETCWCRPVADDDGLVVIWAHNSADGREDFETGRRKPS